MKAGAFQLTKSVFLMVLFAVVMVAASVSMIRPCEVCKRDNGNPKPDSNYIMMLLIGSLLGIITGLVGAGGGFLIIPALVFFCKITYKVRCRNIAVYYFN